MTPALPDHYARLVPIVQSTLEDHMRVELSADLKMVAERYVAGIREYHDVAEVFDEPSQGLPLWVAKALVYVALPVEAFRLPSLEFLPDLDRLGDSIRTRILNFIAFSA